MSVLLYTVGAVVLQSGVVVPPVVVGGALTVLCSLVGLAYRNLNNTVNDIEQKTDENSKLLISVSDKLFGYDGVESDDGLTDRVNSINNELDEVEDRLDSVETRVERITETLDELDDWEKK